MFNPTTAIIHHCIERLQAGYRRAYGNLKPAYADLVGQVATITLEAIAHTDALYHNVEHTVLVTLVGQEILRGKQLLEGNVSSEDWLHFIISLLCHDIGYLKGICHQDRMEDQMYATGIGNDMVAIAPGATDASLTAFHIDRGKRFVEEAFASYQLINTEVIKQTIELTRFPFPNDEAHKDTFNYPGLARAADLIGQLSDPRYLEKLPALFHEFEETGVNKNFGHRHPGDLRTSYPKFFCTQVVPLIQHTLRYLEATQSGKQILKTLYAHVAMVEQELVEMTQKSNHCSKPVYTQGMYHFFLQQDDEIEREAEANSCRTIETIVHSTSPT